MNKNLFVAASALAIISGISFPALAQAQETPDAAAKSPATGENSGEIIVTARKRDERLLDVPVAVSAFSQEQISAAAISSPVELSNFVPGLDFQAAAAGTDGGGSNPNITFRGVRQQLSGPSTQVGAIFWDGSYMGAGAGLVPIEDLQRVEVIKGPQTAYFGRNTFAGAINYVPKAADSSFSGKGELSYSPSDHDSFKISTSLGAPLGDRSGIRLSAVYEKVGADYEFGDGAPLNEKRTRGASLVFTTEPIDDLHLKFSGYYVDVTDTYLNVSIAATSPAGQCNRVFSGQYINVATGVTTPFTRDFATLPYATFCNDFPRATNLVTPRSGTPSSTNTVGGDASASNVGNALMAKYGFVPEMPGSFGGHHRVWRAQLNGDYKLASGHTLNWIGSYSQFGSAYSFDQNFGLSASNLLLPRGFQTYIGETYAEGRFASPQDQRFRYMLGFTGYWQKYRNGAAGPVKTINFENNDSKSVFAALDFDVLENLTLSGEGRYTKDSTYVLLNGDPTLPTTSTSVTFQKRNSFSKFIPRAILTFKPSRSTTIYASYSKSALIGEQTNAAVVSSLDPVLLPNPAAVGDFTPPQQNTSYELGWKQQLGRQLSFSITGFHMKWKNQVFRTTVLAGTQTTTYALPGESKYTGVEIELFAKPTNWLDIAAGLLYVDPKLVDYASRSSFESTVLGSGTLSVVADGNQPTNVSKWHANFSGTVHGDVGGKDAYVRADVIYTGDYFADNLEFNRVKGNVKINLRGGIQLTDNVKFEAYGKNITNMKSLFPPAFTTFGVGLDRKIFTPLPVNRELGVRVLFNF